MSVVKTIDLSELTSDPQNARSHPEKNKEAILSSLARFGAGRSIVVDSEGIVRAGSGTVEAAKQLGIDKIQLIQSDGKSLVGVYRDDWTEEEAIGYGIADNRSGELAEWDQENLKIVIDSLENINLEDVGFNLDDLNEILDDEISIPEIDAAPRLDQSEELQKKWNTQKGQIWQLGNHRLMCGDSTNKNDVKKLLNKEKVGLMVTDPPYGVNYEPEWRNEVYRENGTRVTARATGLVLNDDNADWSKAWELFDGDVAYIWHADIYSDLIKSTLENINFEIKQQIIWAKNNFAIGRNHYHYKHEPCWYVVRKNKTANWIGGHKQTTVWEIDKPQKSETGHSTQKPIECMLRPILNHDFLNVYDPFVGSGTTIMACEQAQRHCFAMELNENYIAVILERFFEATQKEPKLICES
jgi:DNA modification methylase